MSEFDSNFYNKTWEKWRQLKEIGPSARHTRRIICNLIRNLKVNSILDVGCGDGLILSEMAKLFPDATLAGTEFSDVAMSIAKQNLPEAVFYNLDLEINHLPEQYDLVTCVDVLEHINDDTSALKNLSAMTRKYLLVAVPLGPLFPVEKELLGHVHGYSRRELDKKLASLGFTGLKTIQWGAPFYNFIRRVSMKSDPGAVSRPMSKIKRLWFLLIYYLYYINIPGMGERYFVLLEARKK